ncbi:MAG: 4a-hydroxytetrahydrobiopterin dehydratase [Planctomycetes bacterium]|nr:4a-hydroxytetrahydrobiopterin dehydratase [Planctomycetota bacterium]
MPLARGTPPLTSAACAELAHELDPAWRVDGPRLTREWRTRDFADALELVQRFARIAEAEDHHPEITLGYGRVAVVLWTHTVGGLSENDFVLAAKLDEVAG